MPNVSHGVTDSSPQEKRARLKRLLDQKRRTRSAPVSFAQERLWVLEQLEPGNSTYCETGALRLEARLDASSVAHVLNEVVRRHETLRTTFGTADGQPIQIIAPAQRIRVPVVDLTGLPEERREAEAARLAGAASRVPFDLGRGPLLRVSLLRLTPADYVLVITLHHIVADGWSIGVLVREMLALYDARTSGLSVVLPELPIQYGDYARWQRGWLHGETVDRQLSYWRHQLVGASPLELPTDRPRPAVRSLRGAKQPLLIGEELTAALRELGRREGVTLFMTLLAAFQTLLRRYAGQDDVVVGTPVAGRSRREVEGLIGFFVNMLALRTPFHGDPTFRELLGRVREVCLGAYAHEDVPFERIVDDLQPRRDLSRTPLFQVVFALPKNALEIASRTVRVRELQIDSGTAKYDLTLFLWEGSRTLAGHLEYATDLLDSETVARMAEHLQTLLRGVVADPDRRISELPLLSAVERRTALGDIEDLSSVGAARGSLHERFERQVERAPDAPALLFDELVLTYEHLDRSANRLARRLRSLGVGPDVPVAVFTDRSPAMLVAILGVLKAGGAYVPLDPAYPTDRLRFMLEDSRSPVLVTQAHLVDRIPDPGARVLRLDADWPEIARESDAPCGVVTHADNLAYVIYTSGSTGVPKGVLITHGNVLRLFESTRAWYEFGPDDVWTLFHSYAFDFSVWEIWGALLHGGRLVIVPHSVSRLPDEFHDLVRRRGVTVLNQTPSAFRQFLQVEQASPGAEDQLRYVIFGGEALDFQSLAPWFERRGAEHPRLVNMYGITETTVHVTYRPLSWEDTRGMQGSEIGKPIPDLRIYVLDEAFHPLPVGIPGELYVGGAGLARGYHGQPALTACRFLPDPFSSLPGARLYRTGDQARRLSNGDIEYLGRIDHQVKVRGFRVELGEIEAVLAEAATISQVVVLLREDAPGDRRLVAYVVPVPGNTIEIAEIASRLRARLPDHMVPSAFVLLEALPLTANGKLDRAALPAPETTRPELAAAYVAPRDAVERELCGIWCQVLGLARVGVRDNFFELGGDSILAIQVVSRANQAGLKLQARQMFQHQTVSELSRVVGRCGGVEAEQGVVSGEVLLTPIQRWFFERELPEAWHYNQSLLLEVRERLDLARLSRVVTELLEHHDALRLRFERSGRGWRQHNASEERGFELRCVDLSGVAAELQQFELTRVAGEMQSSLDLSVGPLVRVGWFELGGGSWRLLLVIHHLAVDGVSWRVLLEDLLSGYGQLQSGAERIELPGKTTSYRRWSELLSAHATTSAVSDEYEYWREVVGRGTARLPLDRSGGRNGVDGAATVEVELSETETRGLIEDVAMAYRARPDEALLSVLGWALGEWCGGAVAVDVEGHGREDLFEGVDLSRTVGWFTTMYPVVLGSAPAPGPGGWLCAVKETMRGVPRRGVGYGLLRWGVEEPRAGLESASEVLFNYLGRFEGTLPTGSPLGLAQESAGPLQGRGGSRTHVLELNGGVVEGRLRLSFTYGAELHERSTMESLSEKFLTRLRELIAHCRTAEAGGCTPSDFPLSGLDQVGLDRLLGRAVGVEDVYPLTPLQSGMLFHSLYEPETGLYFEQLSCRLSGELSAGSFRGAWEGVVERHAVLRTRFAWEGLREPLQIVERSAELPWTELDWRGTSEEEQERCLSHYLEQDRKRGFDPSVAPLMRLALIRTADDSWRFVWSHHHLLLDGWSLPLLLREVLLSYEAQSRGHQVPLESGRAYREYVRWLREQDAQAAERFWRSELEGVAASTPLGIDRPQAASAARQGQYVELRSVLTRESTAALDGLARRSGLTLGTIVQGIWALLLSRYSGEQDVVYGATVSGRSAPLAEIESMIGLFINTVPVRVRLDESASAVAWLRELQVQLARVREFEFSSLVEVHGVSDVPRGQPLFESLVVFENYPIDEILQQRQGSLAIDRVHLEERTNYPLTLIAAPGERLSLRALYDTRRMDREAVERMLAHMTTLLCGLVAEPEQPIALLSLMPADESRRVVVEWNDTVAAYPAACIHDRIRAQAAKTPEAVALVDGDRALTYAELVEAGGRLARRLVGLGVEPDTLVAICSGRTAEMITGMLGVLEAGGAYVPLDPAYPADRLRFMLEDSRARIALVDERSARLLPDVGIPVVSLESRDLLAASSGPSDPVPFSTRRSLPDHLAYVIYTSGSTGRPKGVAVTHRSVAALAHWASGVFAPEDLEGMLASTSICFDLSVFEIFVPLMHGGRVILAENVLGLKDLRAADSVRLVNTVPSAMAELLRIGGLPPSVQTIALAGEPLSGSLVQRLYDTPGVDRVLDLYGPSEDTVYSTWAERAAEGPETIGRPIANSRAYLLDPQMRPVPPAVTGELFLGGAGLARGYLHRSDLTAERFVPDPFGIEPGARLYRTGDRCRFRDDGRLEFLGRSDHQVKIRGHRIELGEIEAALRGHSGVEDAVAAVREDSPGDRRLVAYLATDQELSPAGLREFLEGRLPEPMVPSRFVVLPSLPRTPNGKVDRLALPAPEQLRPDLDAPFLAPATDVERKLGEIWCEVLKIERVGVHDDFFELGGHSLLATQLVSRVREAFDVDLPLRELFSGITIGRLAERIEHSSRAAALVPIPRVSRDAPLPLSYAQERLWFLDQLEPNRASYNMPAAVRLRGRLNVFALRRAFDEIVRRHESLRTTFHTAEGEPRQVVDPLRSFDVPLVDLRLVAPDRRQGALEELLRGEAIRPFCLDQWPLLRVTLLRLDEHEHVLVLVMHHIVSDGWSMGVLVHEFSALYAAYSANRPSPLAELPVQYADFAAWQRDGLEGRRLVEQLSYWKRQLDNAPALDLKSDRPRMAAIQARGATLAFRFSDLPSTQLHEFARKEGATSFMVLVAAFQILLRHHAGQDDVVLGTDVAGRNRTELEGLIGFFINQLVLRTDLSGNPTFRELLARVRETTLDAYANQDLPFARLVSSVNPTRELGRGPLFDVKLVLQNAPLPRAPSLGLEFEAVDLDVGASKFDILVNLREDSGQLAGEVSYRADLFDAKRIELLMRDFENVLKRVLVDPALRLAAIDGELLTEHQRRQTTRRKERKEGNVERLRGLRRSTVKTAIEKENQP